MKVETEIKVLQRIQLFFEISGPVIVIVASIYLYIHYFG